MFWDVWWNENTQTYKRILRRINEPSLSPVLQPCWSTLWLSLAPTAAAAQHSKLKLRTAENSGHPARRITCLAETSTDKMDGQTHTQVNGHGTDGNSTSFPEGMTSPAANSLLRSVSIRSSHRSLLRYLFLLNIVMEPVITGTWVVASTPRRSLVAKQLVNWRHGDNEARRCTD